MGTPRRYFDDQNPRDHLNTARLALDCVAHLVGESANGGAYVQEEQLWAVLELISRELRRAEDGFQAEAAARNAAA